MLFSNQISFSPIAETRRVWKYGENLEANNAPQTPENKPTREKLDQDFRPSNKVSPEIKRAEAEEKKDQPAKLAQVENAINLTEYSKKSVGAMRDLERRQPAELATKVFYELKDGKVIPLEPSKIELEKTVLTFSVPDASKENKNIEMGVGLRVLGQYFDTCTIDGKRAFKIKSGQFVYENGEYAAVRTHLNQKIIPQESTPKDQQKIAQLSKEHGQNYARKDYNNALDGWLAGRAMTPELIDQFTQDLQAGKIEGATEEIKTEAKAQAETLKEFAELWKGFNIEHYKTGIAAIESNGGNYNADNRGKGARDPWGQRALGKYQFTIDTLKSYGVNIQNEVDISKFLADHNSQEEIMERFTSEHIADIRDNSAVIASIASNKYSIDQVLGAMHLGGAGAIKKVERGQLEGTDYFGTSYATYMSKLKQPTKTS